MEGTPAPERYAEPRSGSRRLLDCLGAAGFGFACALLTMVIVAVLGGFVLGFGEATRRGATHVTLGSFALVLVAATIVCVRIRRWWLAPCVLLGMTPLAGLVWLFRSAC